jgi:hypothetical protein
LGRFDTWFIRFPAEFGDISTAAVFLEVEYLGKDVEVLIAVLGNEGNPREFPCCAHDVTREGFPATNDVTCARLNEFPELMYDVSVMQCPASNVWNGPARDVGV